MDMVNCIQRAIDFIEDNINHELKPETIASQALMSAFHFQRLFSIVCNIPLGEYIRNRRLSLAGNDIVTTDEKIIDIALKYGYESPESFSRAFSKFHGVSPMMARNQKRHINLFAKISVKSILGGNSNMVNYPRYSLGFNVARNDKEILEVFDFYQKAFGAKKLAEFVPYNTHIHIIMEINGIQVLLNQDKDWTNEKRHSGGLWSYDNDDDLRRTIDVLSQDAINVETHSWEHWPINAIIIDKYGVEWLLHNNRTE